MLKLTMMSLGILPLPGTEEFKLQNSYNPEKIDLSWFPIFTTCLSAIGILHGGVWIVKPVADEGNWLTGNFVFFPIFIYRMVAWQIIIITLEIISFLAIAILVFANFLVICFVQSQITLEPISSACLSIVFPMYKLPSQNIEYKLSFKVLFALLLVGNFFLGFAYAFIFLLYVFDLYNPWCIAGPERYLFTEEFFQNSINPMIILFIFSTTPISVKFLASKLRFYF
jgi:hypothetical protein